MKTLKLKGLAAYRGVTLLELLLVLTVIAVILIGVLRLYETTDTNRKVNAAAQQVLQLYQAGAQYPRGKLPVGGDLVKTFAASGYIPSGDFISPWGGSVTASHAIDTEILVVVITTGSDATCQNLTEKFTGMTRATTSCKGAVFTVAFSY